MTELLRDWFCATCTREQPIVLAGITKRCVNCNNYAAGYFEYNKWTDTYTPAVISGIDYNY